MAVELRNLLGASIDQTLPATLLFDHPTVMGLTNYLAQDALRLELNPAPDVVSKTAEPPATADDFDHLSDDEMALLLAEKLDRLGR
jgi:hypothetical protein